MEKKKPPWIAFAMIFVAVVMGGLGIRHYFFKDKHGIKPAKDQHEELTQGLVACFEHESGVRLDFNHTWVDTTCPHDDPRRGIKKGQTAVLYSAARTKDKIQEAVSHGYTVDGLMETVCLAGITLSGKDVFTAWRDDGGNAFLHELAHVARPGEWGNHRADPLNPSRQIYNDPSWGAEVARIEKACRE